MRYGERKKDLGRITHKMLSTQLKQLEAEGFIHRDAYPVVPPKVEHWLTDRGRRAIEGLRTYGLELMAECGVGEEGRR